MSTNNKLPLGYTIRVAHHSDISRILCFYTQEIYKKRTTRLTIIYFFLLTTIPYVLLVLYTRSYLTASISILFSAVLNSISYILIYSYWNKAITNRDCLIIFNKSKICAIMVATSYNNYSYIKEVFVASCYRRKGLATYLMQTALDKLNYPIYLLSISKKHLFDFYKSLGFIFADSNKLPAEIKSDLDMYNQTIKLRPMIMTSQL
ncbi:hypothetical protein NIES267_08970 [Calothrix parasitica NIES-267]|uniref:N-acetyltransferase domain-containing protein n=1 Tax=Calothrix parasitica NIES-267 TaxID=1973488 RepID=A0A1Z4LJM7_9CYAN|nr:hypothetical protein NIES267_08970 [Calothrix parasitica NIES-267]